MHNTVTVSWFVLMVGCHVAEPLSTDDDSSSEDTTALPTFTQRFEVEQLCFDLDGDGEGWAQGCGMDVSLSLVVEAGEIVEGSEMTITGSDTLVINELFYGEQVTQSAPLVGYLDTFGGPATQCYYGRPHYPSDEVSIWLHVWLAPWQRELHFDVSLGGIVEAYGTMLATDPLDPSFNINPDASPCGPPDHVLESYQAEE